MIIIRVKNGGFVSDHKKLNTKKKNNTKTQIFFSRFTQTKKCYFLTQEKPSKISFMCRYYVLQLHSKYQNLRI